MGVNDLWKILEPVKRNEDLSSLRGKKFCVDLSCWICEAQSAKGLQENVPSPHLRNLLFRVLYLSTRLGVKLVFVIDGEPPELKWDAIVKRIQARNGEQSGHLSPPGGRRIGRSHFAQWVSECCTLLKLLGIPYIESPGEGEALCAWLDLLEIVDGCITSDGDAFVYGARTVYRDLSISGKEPSVDCYGIEELESQLNLSRENLVGLAVLLGCDYLPQGVPQVGKIKAMKLIQNIKPDNLIQRFHKWTAMGTFSDKDLSRIEKSIKCKALKDKSFPHPEVIQEYLQDPKVPQQFSFKTFCPDIQKLQEFCLKNLKWNKEKTTEKIQPLITYWQMTSLLEKNITTFVQPEKIVKARVQHKVECYEVEWKNLELGEACPAYFVTVEPRELFAQVYPDPVKKFNEVQAEQNSKKQRTQSTPRIDSFFKNVKRKKESKQQEVEQGVPSEDQSEVILETPSVKKLRLTANGTKTSALQPTEEVIVITDD